MTGQSETRAAFDIWWASLSRTDRNEHHDWFARIAFEAGEESASAAVASARPTEMTDAARAEYWQGVAERALAWQREADIAIAGLEMFFERAGEDSMDRFERIADAFRKETGFLRPGKDCITHDPEVRQAAYDAWVQLKLSDARKFIPAERPAPSLAKATSPTP